MAYTFDELMRWAETEAGGVDVPTRPTIVKELLHYDILHALSRSDLAEKLVFQGGTALRLCYGGQRYSEDLDFTCGASAAEPFELGDMEALLRKHVADRYGLAVTVKPPGVNRLFDGDGVVVKRWAFNIHVPGFVAAQKIHFEVCNVPSYQAAPMLVQPRYSFLSDAYSDIALRVESLEEILADKVVALIARRHVKARDLWDLRWLAQKGLEPDIDLVRSKFADYGVDDIKDRIKGAERRLRAAGAAAEFATEMSRFVTPSLGQRLFGSAELCRPWLTHALELAGRVKGPLLQAPGP